MPRSGLLKWIKGGLMGAALAMGQGVGAQESAVIFAAASLKPALDQIAQDYTAMGQDAPILVYGGSSALARQIQYGAPADIFISANVDWMDALETAGLIDPQSRAALARNRLVLIAGRDAPDPPPIAPGFDLAQALSGGRLAMALVDAVPAGIYGKSALQSLGVWDQIAPHIAQSDHVRGALTLVALGQTPYGITYATDAQSEPRVRIAEVFPADTHPPIFYPAALTQTATPGARALLDYLSSPKAQARFEHHGFLPVGGH